jgi:hypothetical protein
MITDDYILGKQKVITDDYTMQKVRHESKPAMVRLDAETARRLEVIAQKANANTSSVLRAAVFLSLVLLEARPDAVNKIQKPIGPRGQEKKAEPGEPDYDDTMDWLISLLASDLPRHVRVRLDSHNTQFSQPLFESLSQAIEIGSFFLAMEEHGAAWAAASESGVFADELFQPAVFAASEAMEEFLERWDSLWYLRRLSLESSMTRRISPAFLEQQETYQELKAILPDEAAKIEEVTRKNMVPVLLPKRVSAAKSTVPQKVTAYLGTKYLADTIAKGGVSVAKPKPTKKKSSK